VIDFRYHLVSLVAVFMALAVGIVLGAGPLGQEISSTLEAQVRDLREERNDLRAQLDQAQAREELKNDVVAILTPTVTQNQLTGHRVAVVTLPGADRNIVGQLQDQIATAGGQVVQTARLDDAWADPESAATRHEAAAELAPTLTDPEPREGAEPTAETVLAAALTGEEVVAGSGAWRTATDRLVELGFLDVNWADSEDDLTADPPDSFVIVTGGLTTQQVEEDEAGNPQLQQSLDLIAAFGALGTPTLVAGYGTEYGGMRFGSFMFAEYMEILIVSGIASTMFLGGWMGPGPGWLDPIWMLFKMWMLAMFFIWIRATLPRFP